MAKRAIIIFACLITVVIVVSIIISVISLNSSKQADFKSFVSYEPQTVVAVNNTIQNSDSGDFLEELLAHEKSITFFSVLIILVFSILFYGAKRSKN